MSQYDLSSSVIPWLDRHMVAPVLDFLSTRNLYAPQTLTKAKYDNFAATKMVDTTLAELDRIVKADPSSPVAADRAELEKKRAEVVAELSKLAEACGPLVAAITAADFSSPRGTADFTFDSLAQKYKVTRAHVDALYPYAQAVFATGSYVDASDYLLAYRLLSADDDKVFATLWGKLAAEIIIATESGDWAATLEDARTLYDAIEARASAGKSTLASVSQQRTWFVHWLLFPAFASPEGRAFFLEVLSLTSPSHGAGSHDARYLQAAQLTAPWLFRYIAVAVVCATRQPAPSGQPGILRRSPVMREYVRAADADLLSFKDPVTGFVASLLVDFDTKAAADALIVCRNEVFVNDYFLSNPAVQTSFFECARALVVDTLARTTAEVNVPAALAALGLTDIAPAAPAAAAAAEGTSEVTSNATILGTPQDTVALPQAVKSLAVTRMVSVTQIARERARETMRRSNTSLTQLIKKTGAKDV